MTLVPGAALIGDVIWGLIVLAVVVIGVVLFFVSLRLRRHGEADHPASRWRPTSEVFVDPVTERRMRVWVDPDTGERHYLRDR